MKPYTPAFEGPETEPVKRLEKKNTVILGRDASINMRGTQEMFRECLVAQWLGFGVSTAEA